MKKTFKRVLSIALVVLMLLTSAPLQGFVGLEMPFVKAVSETVVANGNCGANGDNVIWTLYDDGVLVISGEGSMANYSSETTPWYSKRTNIYKVIFEEGVTHVGAYSFYCHSNVTELFFSSTITSIGDFAFIACSSLTELILPDTITSIGWGVFEGCTSAESAKIGKGISYINGALFCNCKNLKNVQLSNSVTKIERMTFYGCTSLQDIYYRGTKESWTKTSVGIDNSPLSNAKINYIADGAVEFNGHYYKLFDNGMTWNEAEEYCESLGGHLCTITTEDENNFIKEFLSDSTNYNYWLGGRKYVDSWKWITNEEFSYSNWNEGEPNNDQRSGGEDRLLVYGPCNPSFGEWNDINNDCTCGDEPYFKVETFGFICEWDGMDVDIPFEFNGHYYKLYDAELSWIDSKSFCEELGGYLVTITSEEEQAFIETLLSSADKNMYWMGGLLQEDWAWITGEDFLYSNWGYGEPNNSNAYEAYVQIYAKPINQKVLGDWNDAESDGAAYSNVFYSLENTGLICEWSDEHFEKDTCEMAVTESKEATCLRDGYIVNTCSCGYVYTQVFPATGHKFIDWKTDYKVGDIVQFGSYPQSEVKDETLVAELNALAPEWDDWTSYGYYSGDGNYGSMVQGDWMRYTDVEYNGNKYRGVKFTQYRSSGTINSISTTQQANGYIKDVVYWFSFDSIDWKILDPEEGLIVSVSSLDSQPYNNTLYCNDNAASNSKYFNDKDFIDFANDYVNSSVRKWLNDDFYNTAFAENEQKIISISTLNNDSYYTLVGTSGYEMFDSDETKDKVFLLSYNDVKNSDFGFNSNSSANDLARVSKGSDYAKCQGLCYADSLGSSNYGNVHWLLRSPGSNSNSCCYVDINGYPNATNKNYYVSTTTDGIRPALKLKDIAVTDSNYSAVRVEPTCTESGSTTYICECGETKVETIDALGHDFTDWTTTHEPTTVEEGEKQRTCTVCDFVETTTIDRLEVDYSQNENYGIANFTIVDATTKAPIQNASIFVSTDAEGESTFYTDANGKVSIILPVGENIITAYSKGLISRTLTIDIVHGENEIPAIGLSSSPIVEAELVTTPMTKEEIEDAGIDVTAPENNNVIKYEVTFEFKAPESTDDGSGSGTETKTETVTETFYVNGNGDHFYQNNNNTYEIFGEPVTIHPTERFYLIITGDLIWLKEMFHVQLYAYNNSNTDWIEDTVATLQLPDGLSLADMNEGVQTLSQQMGTITEGGQADCEWYVRGDKEGIYDLTAKLEGRIMPFNEEFSNEYTAEEAIKVYSGKAFNISFEVPSTTYCGDEYPVKIILKNVSDKPIYNVAHVLTGISQTKVTHYSNGEVVEEIYVNEALDKAKFVDEFGPGDEIVLEVTAKILFESEKYKDCFFELTDIIFGAKELGTAINNNFGFPTEHDWGEWETVTEPTCGEFGTEKRVCKHNEDHIDTRNIDKLPHDWDDGVIDPVSTCKDHGVKTYTCKNDASHKKTEQVALDENNHAGGTYIKDAVDETCEEDGYTGNTHCSGCDVKLSEGESITAHGHDYQKIDEKCKAPDYGVAGYDYYECSYDASHNYTVEVAPLVKTTFTATFVTTAPFFAEDKIVAEVTFVQGDKFVEEPAVDKYDNYTFAWDEYELNDEDIIIYGRYTEIEIDEVTDPESEKTVDYKNGIANITLEAKANSKNIKILSEKTKPVDVILVLDQSGSMAETLSTNGKTKRDALVECANDFVNEIYDNAVATGAEHRVAVIGFSYSDYNGGNYKNTGILATADGKSVNYKNLTDSVYSSALLPVVSSGGINTNITKGINSVFAEGATSAHLGLEMANNIFAFTDKQAGRERMVLFITDGTPTSWGEDTSLVKSTAAKAITEANELKNEQGAKIYSIGVHAKADPTEEFTSDAYGVATDSRGAFKSYDFNRFLHAVSSNYKNAGSIVVSEMGEGSKNSGYYLGVQDTSKLSEIFSKILLSSVYEVKTFDKVTIVDTVSKEFTLTLEQETAMREKLVNELGIRNEDITVTRNEDGTTTLIFENVRTQKIYNDDGSSYYSAKVSFDVSADEDSLGLTEVNTNTEDAGVEYDGETIDKFEVPSVILAPDRKLVVFTVNGVAYRIEEAKLGDNIVAPESELAKWNIPEGTVVDGDYVVFEANVIEETKHTVTWVSENHKITETYSFGDEIVIPEAAEKTDYDFLKWSPDVPATMPNYNITFTAAYTPKHTHEYKKAYTYGKCTEGITTVYECACGDSYEEKADVTEHSAKAVVEQTNDGTLVEKVTCQVCGTTNSQQLTYKVTYREGWRNTVLDLTLLENDVSVQPDGTLEIRFYVGENINKNYTVYRIDENGNRTSYTPRKENGYLIFDADHFSFYVVAELDEATGEVADDMSYGEVYCISNGHSYSSVITAPTCTNGGYTTYTCSVCKDTYVADEVSANGHKEETVKGKGATCTETGLTDGAKCSVCGDVLIEQNIIDALGHTEEAIKGEAPTCTNTGLTDGVKCGLCGEVLTAQTEEAKLEHKDANSDYKCDYGCGYEFEKPVTPDEPDTPDEPMEDTCDHLCHKSGFIGFIWKIVRFFIKLFRANKVCSCGAAHY